MPEKNDELLTTGELGFLNKLGEEVPPSLAELLKVPDLGPKKVRLFRQGTGITTLAELRPLPRPASSRPARDGRRGRGQDPGRARVPGPAHGPHPTGRRLADRPALLEMLRGLPGVTAAEAAGSLRRMRSTVGDLDLLATAVIRAR